MIAGNVEVRGVAVDSEIADGPAGENQRPHDEGISGKRKP